MIELKEIRLSLNIDTNDFNTKVNQAAKFLQQGHKVKVSIRFRGREMAHTSLGIDVEQRFAQALEGKAVVDKQPAGRPQHDDVPVPQPDQVNTLSYGGKENG